MVKATAENRMTDCECCFAKLLQAQKGPQQLQCKASSPFTLWLAKTGGHCSSTGNSLWLDNSVRKNGLLKLFAALFHKALVFILWFWALTATKYVVLGFPHLPFLFANTAI